MITECVLTNYSSRKVMEKAGMKYEGILRKRVTDKEGNRNDLIVYSILRNEYFNKE